jgi:hypothetical protein
VQFWRGCKCPLRSFLIGLYASECFVSRQFQFTKLIVRQLTNTVTKKRFGNGAHLKRERVRRDAGRDVASDGARHH